MVVNLTAPRPGGPVNARVYNDNNTNIKSRGLGVRAASPGVHVHKRFTYR